MRFSIGPAGFFARYPKRDGSVSNCLDFCACPRLKCEVAGGRAVGGAVVTPPAQLGTHT
jgi:hypothetical protein